MRTYRKRKQPLDDVDIKIQKDYEVQTDRQRDGEQFTVFNAAEPNTNDLSESAAEISISNDEEALRHLRALQEYAMIHDNFRAIGLLTEVEKSVLNPPQNEDFDL